MIRDTISAEAARRLELSDMVGDMGFSQIRREVVVQFGVPSEVLLAIR